MKMNTPWAKGIQQRFDYDSGRTQDKGIFSWLPDTNEDCMKRFPDRSPYCQMGLVEDPYFAKVEGRTVNTDNFYNILNQYSFNDQVAKNYKKNIV